MLLTAFFLSGCNKKEMLKTNHTIKIETINPEPFWVDKGQEYIQLSSDEVQLSTIKKIICFKGLFFIQDNRNPAINVFSSAGRHVNQIDQLGGGAGEYLGIDDFCVDSSFVYILDGKSKKINKYELKSLKYADKISFMNEQKRFNRIFVEGTDVYLHTSLNINNDPKLIYKYKIRNKLTKGKGLLASDILPPIARASKVLFSNEFLNPIYGQPGFLLKPNDFDQILHIVDNEVVKGYKLDIPNSTIPDNIKRAGAKAMIEYMGNNEFNTVTDCYLTGELLILKMKVSGKPFCYVAYNLKSKELLTFEGIKVVDYAEYIDVIGACNDGLLGVISPYQIENRYFYIEEKQKKGSELTKEDKKFISSFKKNSNPCLVKFKITP